MKNRQPFFQVLVGLVANRCKSSCNGILFVEPLLPVCLHVLAHFLQTRVKLLQSLCELHELLPKKL